MSEPATGMRVLVADDAPVTARVVTAWLERWGYQPLTATTGEAALSALLAADAPPLAILDWMMPGLSGIEGLRQLRPQHDHHDQYVPLQTARESPDDLVEGLEAGADDYIAKPFLANELKVRLRAGRRIPSSWPDGYEALIRRADKALYRAKAAGRDTVELAGDGLGPEAPPTEAAPLADALSASASAGEGTDSSAATEAQEPPA